MDGDERRGSAGNGPARAAEIEAGARGGAPERGTPVLATSLRWLAGWSVWVGATAIVCYGALALGHSDRSLVSFATPLAAVFAAQGLFVLGLLRAEEARLCRELRVARKGTPLLRATVERRRQRGPFFVRLFSTRLGCAAAFLADGDSGAARDVLADEPPWISVGRLGVLHAFVLADVERASGTRAGRERCIRQLDGAPSTGNREADLYRTLVLVKAVLAQGDAEKGGEIARRLADSADSDERVYAAWLRVWLDLDSDEDGWPPLAPEHLRLAALDARSQGADDLVAKLGARLLAILPESPQK